MEDLQRVIHFTIPVFTANSSTDRSVGCFALIFGAQGWVGLVGRLLGTAASTGSEGLTPGVIPDRSAQDSVQTGQVHTV